MIEEIKYSLNTTKAYHTDRLNTLGWELTICNALYPEGTPLRKMLARNDSYGRLLFEYLSRFIPMGNIKRVMEIGGGYGYLMKGFLDCNGLFEPTMLDISPYLLEKQKETLKQHAVTFINEDFLETDPAFPARFDLAVLNENLGDFPTLINLNRGLFETSSGSDDPDLAQMRYYFEKYDFDKTLPEVFHFNLGALQTLEKLCLSGVPYIFLGEHSCEAKAPAALTLPVAVRSTGTPERISLMGHDEYSIKFSYLQKIAETFGYSCFRGPFADFIPFTVTEGLRSIMASHGRYGDEKEIICQFVEDLYKYEYLVIMKANVSEELA